MSIRVFALVIICISVISCRNLQTDFTQNDKCSSIKTKNVDDCFASSANSDEDNCCAISALNNIMCKNFQKKSEVSKAFEAFGGVENMNVYLTTNLLGSAEVICSNNNRVTEDVKTLANNCGNFNNPSVDGCNALSNSNVQCCFSTTFSKSLGNINMNACAGIVAPVTMPSFSMKNDGSQSSLLCGMNEAQKKIIDACSETVPEKEEDCSKNTNGDIECKYATYKKAGERVKMCLGMKGDIQMMMDLGIEPRLRTVRLGSDAEQGFEKIRLSVAFLLSLVFLFIF